jgi:osmotically-inducible protein OsmY
VLFCGLLSAASQEGIGKDADAVIAEGIAQRLAWDRELAPFRLRVDVQDGFVTIKGRVSTPAESHRARRIAEAADGVAGVVNVVEVDSALAPFAGTRLDRPDDKALRARIADTLATDPTVQASGIRVTVDRGRVVLAGQVGDVAQKERAEVMVRSLYGVQSLTNDLRVVRP